MIKCVDCDADLALAQAVRLNEIVECPECRIELEVVSLDPLLVAHAPEAEEDWGE